ncbi:major capsid protein [Pararoseomonas sp. SCSIO 73927]|uniref:major capsid protein n=1 Tax=Pararoseomonas sp. SCSIO 73927 TaxID=3114537 RepID=UPI0030D4667E
MSMSMQQVRIIDPVLSTVSRGYRRADLVGEALFPRVDVPISGGQIIEFGKEAFRLYNARRTPGATTRRIETGYLGKPFALLQDSLEGKVPREWMRDATRAPGVNLGTRATNVVMGSLLLALEYEQAQLARTPGNYPASNRIALAGGSRWTDASVNPTKHIDDGREAIRASVGMYPNTAVLSAKAFAAARSNPNILDRFKYTSSQSVTKEMLAALWNVDRIEVGQAVFASGPNDDFGDVWGSDVVLAYTAIASVGAEVPSFAYTYQMEGHPSVEQAYWENASKSWIYPVTFERAPVIAGAGAGYLIQTAA